MLVSKSPRAAALFAGEAGGHRFQRTPPTDKHGKRHSSTVTVSVSTGAPATRVALREEELEESFCRGSGAGGQNRNKRDTCCVLRHAPTGLTIREEKRTQESNRRLARERMAAALKERADRAGQAARAASLRDQRGSGERSDKVRTYQLHRDLAVDHRNGRECRWSDLERGRLDLLRR